MALTPQLTATIAQWLSQDPDPHTKAELQQLLDLDQAQELIDRFSGRLEFGTAGLRGVVGAGPMRMNSLVIRQTTAGLGRYLLSQFDDAAMRGVIIGYDGRHDSQSFAHQAAGVLMQMGIKVRLTIDVCPTPLVAFGVSHFEAVAGIVITASHNPPEYNGYKVYWSNGAQIIPPHDFEIAQAIDAASHETIELLELKEAGTLGLLHWLQDDFYQTYRLAVAAAAELTNHTDPKNVSLAYTPMHGVGLSMATQLLQDAGFEQIHVVEAQAQPDGSFPTVAFPNPEEEGAMDLVIALAKEQRTMLACANDPDADRFAVAVQTPLGEYQALTGDQVGVLLGEYLLRHAPLEQRLVGNTIVSSSLLSKLVSQYSGECFTTLTGFKWLMNVAQAKQSYDKQFLFAYEEALGYTIGATVWDKDGLTALLAFAQMTAELSTYQHTIWDKLEEIYRAHGFHLNSQVSIKLQPDTPNIGQYLRDNPPTEINSIAVVQIDDLKISQRQFADGTIEDIELPSSDVLIYYFEDQSRVIVRPSGTEPKIKCYYEVVLPMFDQDTLQDAEARAHMQMNAFVQAHQASLPS